MKINLDVNSLAIIVGLFLLIASSTIIGVLWFNQNGLSCIADPVTYANNNNKSYWWDSVSAFSFENPAYIIRG